MLSKFARAARERLHSRQKRRQLHSINVHNSPQDHCYLLDLPPEVRLIIYGFVLDDIPRELSLQTYITDDRDITKFTNIFAPAQLISRLLSVSPQILSEALPLCDKAVETYIQLVDAEAVAHREEEPPPDNWTAMFCQGHIECTQQIERMAGQVQKRLCAWRELEIQIRIDRL